MTPSPAGIALLKDFERGPSGTFAAMPYRCPAGGKTIGWGHVMQAEERFTPPLTEAQAERLLQADLARFAHEIETEVRVPLTPAMFDALVALVFNIGIVPFRRSTLLAELNSGRYRAAADEFLRWDKATHPKTHRKITLPGLTRRRQAERELFLKDGIL